MGKTLCYRGRRESVDMKIRTVSAVVNDLGMETGAHSIRATGSHLGGLRADEEKIPASPSAVNFRISAIVVLLRWTLLSGICETPSITSMHRTVRSKQ
jgi:hypothetical protein